MVNKESEKIILESVQYELNQALQELTLDKEITENTINQLDYQLGMLKEIDLNKQDPNYGDITNFIALAELVLTEYWERHDNETLVKLTVYLTPKHLNLLDNIATREGYSKERKSGSRSKALRYILDNYE